MQGKRDLFVEKEDEMKCRLCGRLAD